MAKIKAFVSWSGGKDSALAYYNVMKNHKVKVECLLNMLSENGTHSRSHHLPRCVLKAQAEAMGIPIVQRQATWEGYEEEFKKTLEVFKEEGIQAGVFGDIDVQEHRDWVERVCKETGLNAILPLWQRTRELLIEEFISVGFKAIIVMVKPECMGGECLGRKIDWQFIQDIRHLAQVDLCGENGEYHTFVYDGPLFKRKIEIIESESVLESGAWFLKIKKYK